jgi:uncharacterized protein YndB with AHSA1/START domain
MGHEFELHDEAETAASPEDVWQAIASGPGIDSWFMGHSDVEPGESGAVRTTMGELVLESAVTAWEPLKRFAHQSPPAEDGRFIAYEFLIEGRDQGSTVLRLATSGFLPGDDWATEFEAMTQGMGMYFRTLVSYVSHFAGRTATPITTSGPQVANWDHAWPVLLGAFGLAGTVREGDPVRVTPTGLPAIDGVVDVINPQCLGIRTGDALYRFVQGFFDHTVMVGHHIFTPGVDQRRTEQAWQAWLTELYA